MESSLRAFRNAFLLAIAGVSAIAQQPVANRVRTGFDAIRESNLRANLSFIAGDGLQGRMSLQPGDDAAAEWVAAEFAKASLQPAAKDASGKPSYLQPVPLVEYKADPAATLLSMTRADGSKQQWRASDISSAYRENVDVSGGLAYVGYGITAPELGYDDYAGIDVRGKIVILMEHEPQETDAKSIFNGTGNTRYATSRVKLLNAQKHGAIAVLMMPEPNATHVTTTARLAAVFVGVTAKRLTPIPAQGIADDELHIPLVTIPLTVGAELLKGAPPLGELQKAIDADLKPHSLVSVGTQLHLQTKNLTTRTGFTYNVAGLLLGSDPTLAAETLIVSGHHDHNGTSEVEEKDGSRHMDMWRGADDNGSGTVGVVELAHAFATNPVKPKRSILFVVFAAEERGPLSGSYYMAQHPLRPLATTRGMVNFDMIGRDEKPSAQTDGIIDIPADTSNRLNLVGTLYSPDFLHTIQREDQHVGLTLDDRFEHETALGIFFRSDQFPFILHDVPAIWFFTGFHPDYHHVTDTVEKIDYPKMTKIVRLAYLTLFDIADETTTPRFIANPALGH
jgi:hypothetical protein